MPDDRQGGQGTQKSGEKNDQQMNDNKQQGQQPQQGKGRQDQQQEEAGTPGGKQGNS